MPYELGVNARVTGANDLQQVDAAVAKLAGTSKLTAQEIGLMERVMRSMVTAGQSYRQALEEISKSQSGLGRGIADTARELMGETGAMNAASAAVRNLGAAHRSTITDVQAASASIRAFEGQLSIRAVEQFTAKVLGLGPAFQAIFPVIGAVAMVEAIGRGVEKTYELYNAWNPVVQAQKDSLAALKESGKEYDRLIQKAVTLADKEFELRNGPEAAARRRESGLRAKAGGADTAEVRRLEETIAALRRIGSADFSLSGMDRSMVESAVGGISIADSIAASRAGVSVEAGHLPTQLQAEAAKSLIGSVEHQLATARLERENHEREAGIINLEEGKRIQDERDRAAKEAAARRIALENTADAMRRRTLGPTALMMGQIAGLPSDLRTRDLFLQLRGSAASETEKTFGAMGGPDSLAFASKQFESDLKRAISGDSEAIANLKRAISAGDAGARDRIGAGASGVRSSADHQARLAVLGAGPGDELSALRQALSIRLQAAQVELEMKRARSDVFDMTVEEAKVRKESEQAAFEFEERILEMRKRQRDEFSSGVAGAYGQLRSQGAGALGGILKSFEIGIEQKIVGNLAKGAYDSISSRVPHAAEGSTLGKLLKGTPFGPDPLAAATTANTAATVANTAAIQGMAGSMLGGAGGSGGFGRIIRDASGIPIATSASAASGGGSYSEETIASEGVLTGREAAAAGTWTDSDGTVNSIGGPAGSSRLGRGVGIAGAAAAGAFGAYDGFRHGGARGIMQGTGALAGAAGGIIMAAGATGPLAPVLMGVGLGLGLGSMLFGDPKQRRSNNIGSTLEHNQFVEPVHLNATMATGGTYADYDKFGNVRGSNLRPFPTVEQSYFDYRNNVTVPGRVDSNFGPPVVVNINAMDQGSFRDFMRRNPDAVADGVVAAVNRGGNRMADAIRSLG